MHFSYSAQDREYYLLKAFDTSAFTCFSHLFFYCDIKTPNKSSQLLAALMNMMENFYQRNPIPPPLQNLIHILFTKAFSQNHVSYSTCFININASVLQLIISNYITLYSREFLIIIFWLYYFYHVF